MATIQLKNVPKQISLDDKYENTLNDIVKLLNRKDRNDSFKLEWLEQTLNILEYKKDITAADLPTDIEILNCDYLSALDEFQKKNIKFDLVFLDPPFRMKVIDEIINFLVDNDMIAEEGYIMAEYPMEDVVEKQYDGFNVKLCRRYSSSEVLILEKE